MNFLLWLYGFGILVAVFQDIKRREVDNWLNLFLLISGSVFVIFNSQTIAEIFILFSMILFFFVLSNVLYYGRFFAGGDAKLLFAMAPLFASFSLSFSLASLGIFLFILMVSGAIYGLTYSAILGIIHFKDVKKVFPKESKKIHLMYILIFSVILILVGLFSSFILVLGIFLLLFSLLYVFAKALEKVAMYRKVKTSILREGDWLVKDVRVGGRIIKSNFNGLSSEEIKLIKKHKKEILIKGGLPFVPAFVIAFVLYIFGKSFLLQLFSQAF